MAQTALFPPPPQADGRASLLAQGDSRNTRLQCRPLLHLRLTIPCKSITTPDMHMQQPRQVTISIPCQHQVPAHWSVFSTVDLGGLQILALVPPSSGSAVEQNFLLILVSDRAVLTFQQVLDQLACLNSGAYEGQYAQPGPYHQWQPYQGPPLHHQGEYYSQYPPYNQGPPHSWPT